MLDINTQYLSKYINTEFNCSFTYFVNSYRIELAKKLMLDSKHSHLSLLGIAMEVGFKTKNTFTRAFQKQCDMTPSSYKKTTSIN
jgi:YesN/AraC family two-component response regulator